MENSNEIWKDIKEYEGLYQVSNFGRVKSLNYNRTQNEKILKPGNDCLGYYRVSLSKCGKAKTKAIHRLVAETFIDNPNRYNYINHIDCNKTNNNVENLEWCTQKHNVQEARRYNLREYTKGKDNANSKKVRQYDLEGNFIKEWDCTMDIQRSLGISNQHISLCCLGKQRNSNGYIWRYVNE